MFLSLPPGPFDLIVADPNWQYKAYSEKGQARAPERHYKRSTRNTTSLMVIAAWHPFAILLVKARSRALLRSRR